MVEKQQLLYEGKSKRVWTTNDPKFVIAEFNDDPMMYHAKKKQYFEGKGAYCNKISAILMQVLEDNNIHTHFVSRYDDNSMVVRRCEMLPIEVVVRSYAAGSIVDRLGLPYHSKLRFPVLEFCYKNDQLGDPVINEYHALALNLCDQEELSYMCYCATRVNKILTDLFKSIGIIVGDFKLEFGRVGSTLYIADEITPNVARFWDENTLDRFDDKGAHPEMEYQVILDRLQKATGIY